MNRSTLDESQRIVRTPYWIRSGGQVKDAPCQNRCQRNPKTMDRASEGQDAITGSNDTESAEATLFASDPFHSDDTLDWNHRTQLRLLTGWLDDMSFAEVATVVGIDQSYLRDVLHEDKQLESTNYRQIERMLDLTRKLRLIMKPEIIGWWYRTSDPKLSGESPLELLAGNRTTGLERLERVVNSYFNSSYG